MVERDESIYLGPPRPGEGPYAPVVERSLKDDLAPEKNWRPDYLGVFAALHRQPHWLASSFYCGLFGLIPIVGLIAQLGYTMQNVESLHRTNGRVFAAFDFGQLAAYLKRGVGPFLVVFALGMTIWIVQFAVGMSMGWSADLQRFIPNPNEPINLNLLLEELGRVMARDAAVSWSLQFLVQPLAFALALRGGLSDQIGESFAILKAFDFVRRTLVSIWLTMFLYFLIALPLSLLGVLACVVGAIPVSGYLVLINAWLSFQLYRVYLNRGGEPIPLPPAPLVAELA